MTMFIFIVVLMIVFAVGLILMPMLGKTRLKNINPNEQNIAIAKERLNELDIEFEKGLLTDVLYQQQKDECQKSLLSHITENRAVSDQSYLSKVQIFLVLLLIPVLAIPLYLSLGNTNAVDSVMGMGSSATHKTNSKISMNEALNKLERNLEKDPGNIKGWHMLGRSYMTMERYSEAADIYKKLHQIIGDEVSILLPYADALSMSRNGEISGAPFDLIKKALKLAPDNITALWLAGIGYSEEEQYQLAIDHWEKLLPLLKSDHASQNKIRALIAKAQQYLTQSVDATTEYQVKHDPVAGEGVSVKVTVSLSGSFKSKVNADDVVFIYAKATQGPPMPLAAVRKRVADLPVTVILDDTMAMMPQMKLSSFDTVDIGARISKTGSAMPQPGDIQGMMMSVKLEQVKHLKIEINSVR